MKTTVSTKGQIILPAEIRQQDGIELGRLEHRPDLLTTAARPDPGQVDGAIGQLRRGAVRFGFRRRWPIRAAEAPAQVLRLHQRDAERGDRQRDANDPSHLDLRNISDLRFAIGDL